MFHWNNNNDDDDDYDDDEDDDEDDNNEDDDDDDDDDDGSCPIAEQGGPAHCPVSTPVVTNQVIPLVR